MSRTNGKKKLARYRVGTPGFSQQTDGRWFYYRLIKDTRPTRGVTVRIEVASSSSRHSLRKANQLVRLLNQRERTK